MIDRHAAVPLYHQIYLQLRDEILSGERVVGSSLPTEHQLSSLYAVSRMTARRVLSELAKEQFVERRRRAGTRVIFQSPTSRVETTIDQAAHPLTAYGARIILTPIETVTVSPPPNVAQELALSGDDRAMRLVRLGDMDGTPLGHFASYVPVTLGVSITAEAMTRTPTLTLLEKAGHRVARTDHLVRVVHADAELGSALGVEMRTPLVRIGAAAYDRADRPFLVTVAHYRADRFAIRFRD